MATLTSTASIAASTASAPGTTRPSGLDCFAASLGFEITIAMGITAAWRID